MRTRATALTPTGIGAVRASAVVFATAVVAAPAAHAGNATSASFQIQAGTLDTAGGRSTSANHVVTACVGSEIAGSSSSASHRIDSGCGATALAVVIPNGGGPGGGVSGSATPVPALSDAGMLLLVAMLCAVAARRMRPRPTRPPGP